MKKGEMEFISPFLYSLQRDFLPNQVILIYFDH